MQKRRLGETDLLVSCVGLGTVKLGRNEGVKYPHPFALPSDKEAADLLAVAADLGVNLLDTAPAYGSSEMRLGALLQGQRHQWVISTKVGEEFVAGESQFDFSSAAIHRSIDRSLQRLQTDYLDIVLVHSNGDDERLIQQEGVFFTLDILKQAGKIRAYGMSTKTVAGGLLVVDKADVAMITYNPTYTDEETVIHHAAMHHKGIFVKKAFASGHLPAAESMRFVLAQPGVTSVIVGTLNPLHLRENIRGANL